MNQNGFDKEFGSIKDKGSFVENQLINKGSLDTQGNYKIREFEWFEIETKIRKFVNELLQPTILKISLEKKIIEDVHEKIEDNNERVKQLFEFIHYNGNKVKILDEIFDKIAQTNTNTQMIANQSKQDIEKMELFKENILSEFQHVRTEIKQAEKARDQYDEDKQLLMEYFDNFKKNTQEIIQSLTKDLGQQQNQSKMEFMKVQDSISKIQHTLSQNESEIKLTQSKTTDYFERITNLSIKNNQMQTSIEKINSFLDELKSDINAAKKLAYRFEDIQNRYKMVENYIDKYNGLIIQGQISESLFSFLDKPGKRKLVNFEEKVFAKMNQNILNDDGEPNLEKKMKESVSVIENILRRNAKFLHQRKQDSSEDISESLYTDNLSKSDLYFKNEKQNLTINKGEPKNVKKGESIKNTIHEKKLSFSPSKVSVHSNGSDSEVSYGQFTQLKNLIEMEIQKMKEQINQRTSSLGHGIVENEEILQLSVNKIQEEMEQAISLLRKQQNTIVLETGSLDTKIQSIWGELSKIVNTFNILSETVHKLIHFNTLNNSLSLQDELDKQNIALFGYKTSFNEDLKNSTLPLKTNPLPLSLDERCLSCNGQSAQIAQTFKMACLAYHPSAVLIEGQEYKREEILEVATRLLHAARQQYGLKDGNTNLNQLDQLPIPKQNIISSEDNDEEKVPLSNNKINVSIFNKNNNIAPEQSYDGLKQRSSSAKVYSRHQLNSQGTLLNKQSTTHTQNSVQNNLKQSQGQFKEFKIDSNNISSSQMFLNHTSSTHQSKFRSDSKNQIDPNLNSSLILPQSNLPLVDGLKPRSRALSKKPNSRNNNVRLISYSSAYNKEIFLNDK